MTRAQSAEADRRPHFRGYSPDSLQNRIRQFFLANPDEELTYPDLCIKFGCTLEQAHGAIRELTKRDGDRCPVDSVRLLRGKKVGAA